MSTSYAPFAVPEGHSHFENVGISAQATRALLRSSTPTRNNHHGSRSASPTSTRLHTQSPQPANSRSPSRSRRTVPHIIPIPRRSSFNYIQDLADLSPTCKDEGHRTSCFSSEDMKHRQHMEFLIATAVEAFRDGGRRWREREEGKKGRRYSHGEDGASFSEA